MDVKAKANIGTISIGGKNWDFPVYQGQNKRSQNKMKTLTQFVAILAIGLLASINTLRAAEGSVQNLSHISSGDGSAG